MPVAVRPQRRQTGVSFTDAGERAFAYAKACGIIGKSYVEKRISALANLHTLAEFDRLVFPEAGRELPGRELLADLEGRILRRTTRHLLAVIGAYSSPPELLVRQLRSCEYADLKTCLHHISAGKPLPHLISDIGRFRTIRFEAYPDLAAMLDGTEFTFILEHDGDITSAQYDFTRLETELDRRYYTLLVRSLRRLSVSDRLLAERILAEEISLRNCVWALRLRSYFNKTQEETAEYLMDLKMAQSYRARELEGIPGDIRPRTMSAGGAKSGRDIFLADEARSMLHFPMDTRSAWKGWRWERLLNPVKADEHWAVDPRYFQNAASRYIYRLSWRCFSRMPFSISAIFCYIKLKEFEEDLLTSVAEGLGLGMAANDVFSLLEAQ